MNNCSFLPKRYQKTFYITMITSLSHKVRISQRKTFVFQEKKKYQMKTLLAKAEITRKGNKINECKNVFCTFANKTSKYMLDCKEMGNPSGLHDYRSYQQDMGHNFPFKDVLKMLVHNNFGCSELVTK